MKKNRNEIQIAILQERKKSMKQDLVQCWYQKQLSPARDSRFYFIFYTCVQRWPDS